MSKLIDNCITQDQRLAKVESQIAENLAKPRSGYPHGSFAGIYDTQLKSLYETKFKIQNENVSNNCEEEIEVQKLEESADILGMGFAQSDEDVLKKANIEKNILFAVGGLTLLVGLVIIIKK